MSDLNNWNVAAESGYQYTTDPPDGFPEGKLPSVVNNVIREVMASIKRRYADANGSIVSTGTGGAYAVTANETVSALYDGLRVSFRANHTNVGASTLNWDATGVTAMKKNNGDATAAGDIPSNAIIDCVYNSTNSWWQVLNARESTANVQIDMFSGTGAQTGFVLSADPAVKKNVAVYIDGVYQQNATYSVSGTTLTFTEAPPSGTNNVEVRINAPAPAAAVDDDSVTLAKMASGTAGGVVVYDAAGDPADLGAGTSGQVVVSQGPSAAPVWGTGVPTGVAFPYIGSTAPAGYVLAAGGTIGSAASMATERANADTENLYTLLWDSWDNNEAPVTGGRGVSAAADFAADKPLAIPDMKGTAFVGLDNMGGSAAGRITSASVNGANGTTPGGRIGDETHQLTVAEMPAHTHGLNNISTGSSGEGRTSNGGTTRTTASTGGGGAHSNTQPGMMWPIIVKL